MMGIVRDFVRRARPSGSVSPCTPCAIRLAGGYKGPCGKCLAKEYATSHDSHRFGESRGTVTILPAVG